MTIKEQLQQMIDAQIKEQAFRFESIGFKKDEAMKFENFAQTCYEKINLIEKEIDTSKYEIIRLQAIVDAL